MVLDAGKIVFLGSVAEFKGSALPQIRELSVLDNHNHAKDHHYTDPWSKQRMPRESIL
jgi:hypothetical protein